MKSLFSILCLVFFLVSCSGIRTVSHLNERNELVYEPNQNTPFTGRYVSYWDERHRQKSEKWTYKNGKRDGVSTSWFSNGKKSGEETYKNGEKDGQSTYWYITGNKKEERIYKDGQLVELKPFDENMEDWDKGTTFFHLDERTDNDGDRGSSDQDAKRLDSHRRAYRPLIWCLFYGCGHGGILR